MKKFLGLILVLVCFVTPAFAEPVSQEIIEQAKAQAGLFMDLKNALGLDWLDQYNAYLASPDSAPQPTWATSVVALINNNYLSSAFPTDFQIVPTGQEVTIRRTITDQGVKNVLPVYLPSVMISGNTVSLLVQRPAQWVAWEAGLNSKISKDGSDNPDVLPNASLEFGSGSKIEFVSNDGKLIGVDNLTYKGQELEDRFVNAAGDNMTGALTISGNKVWHAGNDGSGSGLDADLLDGKDSSYYRDADKLDGQHGSFYQNASNLNAGTVPVARLSGKYNISISGDADTVDGKHASDFALSGHSHNYDDKYVNLTGDTMTGILTTPEYRIKGSDGDTYPRIQEGSNDAVRIRTNDGYVDIGPANTSWVHFYTDRPGFYFDKPVEAETRLKVYGTNTYLTGTEGRINNQTIWHKGNDGSGSGLDADLLDGKDSSAFALAHDHPYVKKAGDTMTGSLIADIDVGPADTRVYKNLASFKQSVSSITGTLKITLPKSWSNTMMRIRIAGYNYSSTGAWEAVIGGYNYSSGWVNYSAEIRGKAPFSQIRLGYDGSKCVILLGDISTKWSYPHVVVEEMLAGHSSITGWETGWAISVITSESGITKIVTPAIQTMDNYVKKSGDTMTGNLSINHNNNPQIKINAPATGSVSSIELTEQTNYGLRMFYDGRDSGDTAAANVIGGLNNGTFNEVMRFKREGGPVIFSTAPKVGNNIVWHAGNDGLNSGLDADKLDGQDSSFYQNASNLNTGLVPAARLSGTYGISITGNAATATTASNSDKLDGYHHDAFVKRAGDTMTGALTAPEYRINDSNTRIYEGGTNSVRLQTNYGYVDIGPRNASLAHFYTDMPAFYFSKPVEAVTHLKVYGTNTYFTSSAGYISGSKVWTQGNDGSGSGLDADLLDGKHASAFASSGHTHNYVSKSGDTMTGTLTLQGTSINIQRPETSGGYARGIMFYSKDGSTVEAGIGMLGSGNNPPQTLYMGFGTSPWNSSAGLTVTPTNITFKNNKVWHAGNDGSGSGLDADMLDGKHWSDIQNYINDKHNPNKKIYFVAQRSPSQYIAWENKANLTIEEDPYNCFDIATDRFIAPREGLYFFSGVGILNPGKGAHIYCFFKVNGNILPESQFSTETGNASNTTWDWQSHTSTILHLKTGDYVELWVGAGGWHVSKIVFYGIEL